MRDYKAFYNFRSKRKDQLMCIQCGGYLDRLGIYCSRCNGKNNISKGRAKKKLIAARICLCCNKPVDREGIFCSRCTNHYKLLARARNAFRRAAGLCVQCGADAEGYSYCKRCRELRMERYWAKKLKGET